MELRKSSARPSMGPTVLQGNLNNTRQTLLWEKEGGRKEMWGKKKS